MAMPITTMNKDRSAVTSQDQIGSPRQALLMKAKSEPCSVQQRAQTFLRAGILAADARHVPAAPLFGQDVDHHARLGMESSTSATSSAICRAKNGGTAFPT